MDYNKRASRPMRKFQTWHFVVAGVAGVTVLGLIAFTAVRVANSNDSTPKQPANKAATMPDNIEPSAKTITSNPLAGKSWYVDSERTIVKQVANLRSQGRAADADILDRAAKQSSATWLIGPNAADPAADRDIREVERTSRAAAEQGTVPLYQLYAMPKRDACAGYSAGGFQNDSDYEAWIRRILDSLQTPAVFAVEADAIGHTIRANCLSPAQTNARYALLNRTVTNLQQHPKVLAVYLDAAHSEWFSDPKLLVEPLRKSGIDKIRGVSVNVSNFIATPTITTWSQRLVAALKDSNSGNKGVLIDTGRNGQGAAPGSVRGDARWCNPSGRGLGLKPTTDTKAPSIDAYVYIKTIGESDGNCFGNPSAGTFILSQALELSRNARQE